MSLINKIRAAQVHAAEQVVIESLRGQGLAIEADTTGKAEPTTPETPAVRWCHSFDGESFIGPFDSEDDALADAQEDAEAHDQTHVHIGQIRRPREWINARGLGEDIEERIGELLSNQLGEHADAFELMPHHREALGRLVLDWLERDGHLNVWGVKNAREVPLEQEGGAA